MDRDRWTSLAAISAGLIVLSYALADLFISAKQAMYSRSVAMALVAWLSYIWIHYAETGRIIDPRSPEKQLPDSERNWFMLVVAAVLFSAGMSVGSLGVAKSNLPLAASGAASLITGYFIAHYEFTDLVV